MELKATISMKGAICDGKAPEIIRKDLLSAMHEADMLLVRGVRERTPQGVYGMQGGLRASIAGEIIEYGTSITDIVSHGKGTYGDVVELGRRPGSMPPRRPIIEWAGKKLGLSGAELRSAVRGIQWKIYHHGTIGAFMFERTWNESQGKLTQIFDRAGFDIALHLSEGKS